MGDGLQVLELLLFALVAAFLVLRLRNVLGRRDGHRPAQRDDPFSRETASEDKVVRLPDRDDRGRPPFDEEADEGGAAPGTLQAGLAQIRTADRSFDPEQFVGGARVAFEIILDAFAKGDDEALKPLLSPEVYANFLRSIRERLTAGETLETELIAVRGIELTEAYMAGRTAHVTVRIASEQIRVVRDASGAVIEGDPAASTEVIDVWTFARDTRSPDPNWHLVATGAPE
ncbi:MAG: Tim44/TimA family putative adaptor protein [Rhodospirillales bacterium]|nr:Tim44/TimA family putative adaptor protein [Rhodospirillales bacterium]